MDLNDQDEGEMSFQDSILRMQLPLTVRNNGFFDINDLQVTFVFMDLEGNVLAISEGEGMDIPAGKETDVRIGFELDLYDLDRTKRSDLIFNGTEIRVSVEVSAGYTMNLVDLSVEVRSEFEWGPMITDLEVRTWNAQLEENGPGRYLRVPFSFHADEALHGLQALAVTEYRDGFGYLSNFTQTMALQQQVEEEALIPLSQEAYERLMNGTANATVRTYLYFLDCYTYDEGTVEIGGGGGTGAPIQDVILHWELSYIQDFGGAYSVWVPYSFRAGPGYQGQQALVRIEYWDTQGYQGGLIQYVTMWDQVWEWASIPLTQEAYDRVYYGQEQVRITLSVEYQTFMGYDERSFMEQWGMGP